MNFEKLSSEEVPNRFAEWLLKMGCPAEKVPNLEKIPQMCRGQYYIVWRSLMEQVHPKEPIRQKRLNVFCDDIRICEENKANNKPNVNVPEQLELWRQQMQLKEKVDDAEARVELSRNSVKELTEKESVKLIQRNNSKRCLDDKQRQICLLRQVSESLAKKQKNMDDAKNISRSMWTENSKNDIQKKLDECLSMVNKELTSSGASSEEPVQDRFAKSEQLMCSLLTCGDSLWPLLLEQRAAAAAQLIEAKDTNAINDALSNRMSPYFIISLTSSINASMALEVMKNRVHIKQTRNKIAAALDEINNTLPHDSCELLVLQCEIVHMEAKMQTVRNISEDMVQHRGAFGTEHHQFRDQSSITNTKLRDLDDSIMNEKMELCRLIKSLAIIEKKIYHMRDCVQTVFNVLKNGWSPELRAYTGMKLDLPEEPINNLCQFFRERGAKVEAKTNMSMVLDVSDVSYNDVTDTSDITFVDELKMFLKKFNLEKNRKLVLDSGEKIWIFETLQSSVSRLNSHWLDNNLPILFCPVVGISNNMQNILDQVRERDALRRIAKNISNDKNILNIEVQSIMEEEAKITDAVKKRDADNILRLKNINKTLEISQYNLKFWANDECKKHISPKRTVDGMNYKEYVAFYLENIIIKS